MPPAPKMHRRAQKPGVCPTRKLGVKLHAGQDKHGSYACTQPNPEEELGDG